MKCAGILLTGGSSSRLGQDKAALHLRPGLGLPLAEQAAGILTSVAAPVVEVGPGRSGLPLAKEHAGRRGPLVAVAAGLETLGMLATLAPESAVWTEAVIVLACDMPLVTPSLLGWLVDHPAAGPVIPLAGDPPHPQPLCARWGADVLATIAGLVARGERSLRPLLAHPSVVLVAEDIWSAHAGAAGVDALHDIDTPQELARVRALVQRLEPRIGI